METPAEFPASTLLVLPDRVPWKPLMEGAESALLYGDPESDREYYSIRFRTSKEIVVPPHWHPGDEYITVLQGPFSLGFGEVFESHLLEQLPAGSWVRVPRQVRHFALYAPGTVVQVSGLGPFRSNYVNVEDELGEGSPCPGAGRV